MSISSISNNPGNLTVAYAGGAGGPAYGSASDIDYAGQTSGYTSSNGYTYAVFDSIADGYNALVSYVQRHLGSASSAQQLAANYLGTSTPNAVNANPSGYAAQLSAAFATGNPATIATAIVGAEGNSAMLGGVTAASAVGYGNLNTSAANYTGASTNIFDEGFIGSLLGRDPGQTSAFGLTGSLSQDFSNLVTGGAFAAQNGVGATLGVASGMSQPTTAQAVAATATAKQVLSATNPLTWIKSGGLIVLGVLLVGIAAFLLARGGKALSN